MADKRYIATLVQSGTTIPVATIIRNTYGAAFVYTRTSGGLYVGTLASALNPTAKTTIEIRPLTNVTSVAVTNINSFTITMSGDDTLANHEIEINTYDAISPVQADASAVITLQEVKDFLKIPTLTLDDDNYLQTAINEASTEMENYINNKIVVQTLTDEIYDGNGTNRIYTNYSPIVGLGAVGASTADQLAALRVRDTVDDSFAAVETDINHIHLDIKKPYIALYDEIFPYGRQTVKITYRAGWSVVPTEFKEGCLMLVIAKYKDSRRGQDRFGKESESINGTVGSSSIRYTDIRKKVYELISGYRKFV
jgi:hypothetical protein